MSSLSGHGRARGWRHLGAHLRGWRRRAEREGGREGHPASWHCPHTAPYSCSSRNPPPTHRANDARAPSRPRKGFARQRHGRVARAPQPKPSFRFRKLADRTEKDVFSSSRSPAFLGRPPAPPHVAPRTAGPERAGGGATQRRETALRPDAGQPPRADDPTPQASEDNLSPFSPTPNKGALASARRPAAVRPGGVESGIWGPG